MGASMPGAFTARELKVDFTRSNSLRRLMIPLAANFSNAAKEAFSRTVKPAAKPSVCRSEGMKAAASRSSLLLKGRP